MMVIFKISRSSIGKGWLSMCSAESSATQRIKDVNILMAIQWAQEAWKEVTGTAIKNCFEKYEVVKSNDDLTEVEKVRELSLNMSSAEYVYFDADIVSSEPMINDHEVDWRERLGEDCINDISTQSNVSEET